MSSQRYTPAFKDDVEGVPFLVEIIRGSVIVSSSPIVVLPPVLLLRRAFAPGVKIEAYRGPYHFHRGACRA